MKKVWFKAILSIYLLSNLSCTSSDPRERYYKKTHINDIDFISKNKRSKKYRTPSEMAGVGYSESEEFANNLNYATYNEPDEYFIGLIHEDIERYQRIFGQYDGHFKIGEPYRVMGEIYEPKNYKNYEEMGVASWYGEQFHGKTTANGEVYDMDSMTAAHKTLPLPSIVRVTNLENNKSVIVRVNDRGPFVQDRVIDVSKKAAKMLEFKNSGTATVKVELLRDDTEKLLEKLNLK